MTPLELSEKYYMHDSVFESVTREEGGDVRIVLRSVLWEEEPGSSDDGIRKGTVEVLFVKPSVFTTPEDLYLDEISILQVKLEDGQIKFAIHNNYTDAYDEICIEGGEVRTKVLQLDDPTKL